MSKNNVKPEIRFKNFTDAWEQRKLGEVSDIVGGGTPSTSKKEYWDGDIDWYSPAEIGKDTYASGSQKKITELGLKKSSAKILSEGTVLFTSRAGIGKTAILAKEGATNQGFQSIVPKPELLDTYFIFSKSNVLKRYGEVTGAGSTFVEVSGKQMAKMPILLPSLEEQARIGTFFKQLDKTITLHQHELTLLKQRKKAFLQKMFPKKGESSPGIHFSGFSKEWKRKKLSELTNYKNGKGHEGKQSSIGKYQLINLNSISINGGLKDSGKFIDETNETLLENDLVMILSDIGHGDLLGRVALIPENNKYVLNQRVALIRPNNNVYPLYLLTHINQHQRYFKKHGAGMSQLNLSKKSVEDFESYYPIMEEQIKIGNFFKELDNSITLQEEKLESLKQMKKAFLQKMFV